MPYRSKLEARIAKKTTQAITDFRLLEDGDRVMVALSGGKDSWTLLQVLDELRKRAPIGFELLPVTIDEGFGGFRHDVLAEACAARGWRLLVRPTTIGTVVGRVLEPDETVCALCSRLRRGVLYRVAGELGATKIALGHHRDDCLETLLLNLFFGGTLKAMPARLLSDNRQHVVIRPLVYVSESETSAYAASAGFPIVSSGCPACHDRTLERQRIKGLLADLERQYPGVKRSMLRALRRVVPSHLLDATLWPTAVGPSGTGFPAETDDIEALAAAEEDDLQ